jgi:thiamine biosynthesis lipoprotein
LLGTLVAVEATSTSAAAAEAAVEAAFAAMTQIDRRMHPHSADSDLARINHAPLQTSVTVHSSTCVLLNLARRLNTLTDGVFDPCLPSRPGRLQDIEVTTDQVLCHAPVALDFGGFAKGYAVDRAIEALTGNGCTAGLVNAGGDLRVFGRRSEPIFLRGPAGELTQVALADASLAVSDTDSPRRPAEHQGYYIRDHHARHAAGGNPLSTRYAAVIAKETVIADALAKCVLLCPKDTVDRALRSFDATQVAA